MASEAPAACWAHGCDVPVTRLLCPQHRAMLAPWVQQAVRNCRQAPLERAETWTRLRVQLEFAKRLSAPHSEKERLWQELWSAFEAVAVEGATMEEWLAGGPSRLEQAKALDELAREVAAWRRG